MQITKKDGIEEWDNSQIIEAILLAADRVNFPMQKTVCNQIAESCKKEASNLPDLTTAKLHPIIINQLKKFGYNQVADAYQSYRDFKVSQHIQQEKLAQEIDKILNLGDRENANFDSSLISTKGSLIKGAYTKELYQQNYLSKNEKFLIKRGDIYIHDLRDMVFGSINCCLFDMANLLKDGFVMSELTYAEPNSVLSALQVIGDVTLVATAQQFGGFTIPEVDKVLLPYVYKSLSRSTTHYESKGIDPNLARQLAVEDTKKELLQGFQALEGKLNAVPCSRGDFAFTTLTFGQWNIDLPNADKYWLSEIGKAMLTVRQTGFNGVPVLFPKLVYLYDENQIDKDNYSKELFDESVKCSAKCMYPDYLSLTGSIDKNAVAQEYANYGTIISPMGCRAYLSHWEDPETGKAITTGRCNIGAVSLNIPLIIAVAQKEFASSWRTQFWNLLADRLEVIRKFLQKRYKFISKQKASNNPLAFMQGGFYKGTKKRNEHVGDLIQYMTASFGITALHEATVLWTGKSLYEDKAQFANKVIDFISAKVNKFKEEDGHLYALYATPAESLSSKQAQQYKEYTGDDRFGEFFSNGFHCHVSEDITPVEKQDTEFEAFHKVAGGHIQYVRIDNPENIEAVRSIILRGMKLGFYQGINFDMLHCKNCGKDATNSGFVCPHCHSTNTTVISRVCGYLGYSNINGTSRMNEGKMAEIAQRRSM